MGETTYGGFVVYGRNHSVNIVHTVLMATLQSNENGQN